MGLAAAGLSVDFACFALDATGQLRDERYMTFFNQPCTPCGEVQGCSVPNDAQGFAFTTSQLSAWMERAVIAASASDGTMSQISVGHLRLVPSQGEAELARSAFAESDFSAKQALMLGELHRKNGALRFMAVSGQHQEAHHRLARFAFGSLGG